MKRHLILNIIFATLLWSSLSFAVGELGENDGDNDNPHNLSSLSKNSTYKAVSETQICIFCHVPHGATPQSILWGRPDPLGPNLDGTFPVFALTSIQDPGNNLGIDDDAIKATTLYGNNTNPNEYPNGASKLCLSCHDGVTAIGILANNTVIDMNTNTIAPGPAKIDLAISHPISFVYTQAVETYLNSAAASKTYDFNYYSGSKVIPLDGQSRIQCTVCHEPHKNTKIGTYSLPFWRMAGKGADAAADYDITCKECHSTTYYGGSNHNIP